MAAAHSVRPHCHESPRCSQDRLEIAHRCTTRHSCRAAAHGSESYCPGGFNRRSWAGEAWSCRDGRCQPASSSRKAAESRAAGLRLGGQPGSRMAGHHCQPRGRQEKDRGSLSSTAGAEPSGTKGQTPRVPRVPAAPDKRGSDSPSPGLGMPGAALHPKRVDLPMRGCTLRVTLPWQQPLHRQSLELTSYADVRSQDARDGQTAETAAEAQPRFRAGFSGAARAGDVPIPRTALGGTACLHARPQCFPPLCRRATVLADEGTTTLLLRPAPMARGGTGWSLCRHRLLGSASHAAPSSPFPDTTRELTGACAIPPPASPG